MAHSNPNDMQDAQMIPDFIHDVDREDYMAGRITIVTHNEYFVENLNGQKVVQVLGSYRFILRSEILGKSTRMNAEFEANRKIVAELKDRPNEEAASDCQFGGCSNRSRGASGFCFTHLVQARRKQFGDIKSLYPDNEVPPVYMPTAFPPSYEDLPEAARERLRDCVEAGCNFFEAEMIQTGDIVKPIGFDSDSTYYAVAVDGFDRASSPFDSLKLNSGSTLRSSGSMSPTDLHSSSDDMDYTCNLPYMPITQIQEADPFESVQEETNAEAGQREHENKRYESGDPFDYESDGLDYFEESLDERPEADTRAIEVYREDGGYSSDFLELDEDERMEVLGEDYRP